MNRQLKLTAYLAGVSAAALAVDTQAVVIHQTGYIEVEDGDSDTVGTDRISYFLPILAFVPEKGFTAKELSAEEELIPFSINLFPRDATSEGTSDPLAVGKKQKQRKTN